MRGSEDGSYEITACRRRQMSLKVDSEILNMQQAIGTPKPSSPPSLSREKKLRRQEIALWNLLHDVDIESFTELRVGWIGYITQHSSGVCK